MSWARRGQCWGAAASSIVTVSVRQRVAPPELPDQVNIAYRMVSWGLMSVGGLAGGLVARVNPRPRLPAEVFYGPVDVP